MDSWGVGELQVKELLREVRVELPHPASHPLPRFLHALRQRLVQLPPTTVTANTTTTRECLEFLGLPKTTSLSFEAPEVEVVGSYVLHTMVRPHLVVDVAVEMPSRCFLQKDYRDHRYHGKRALYLQHLENATTSMVGVERVEVENLCGDLRKPTLVLTLAPLEEDHDGDRWRVRLIPGIHEGVFPAARLAPEKANLRTTQGDEGLALSPLYNHSILEDMALPADTAALLPLLETYPELGECIVLLKVWGRRRELLGGAATVDGLGASALTVVAAHLRRAGGLPENITAAGMFCTCLSALAAPSSSRTGAAARRLFTACLDDAVPAALQSVVLVTGARPEVNLAARTTAAAFMEVAHDAAVTASHVTAAGPDSITGTFLTPLPHSVKFDAVLQVMVEQIQEKHAAVAKTDASLDEHHWRHEEMAVEAVVREALGDRASLCRVVRRPLPRPQHTADHHNPIAVGLLLNAEAARRQIDVGPRTENTAAAAAFRAFWGDRCELRRFRDGTVCESVLWAAPPHQRHLIVPRIVTAALERNLPVVATANQRCRLLQPVACVGVAVESWLGDEDPAARTAAVQAAVDSLNQKLRKLAGAGVLPLGVQAVVGASAALRATAVPLPVPHALAGPVLDTAVLTTRQVPRRVEPLELMITLEGSGKWPDDPVAVRKTKTAFLLQVARGLAEQHKLYAEATEGSMGSEPCLDVLHEGFAFRLFLLYERDAPPPHVQCHAAPAFRASHAAMLQPLQTLFPAYSATVRLAKRWTSVHMLCPHVHEEAIELLVASVFVSPGAARAPATASSGLHRWLRLIADHPWDEFPLVVDPAEQLSSTARGAVTARFDALRRTSGGGPAMFLASAADPECASWTSQHPSKPVLARLVLHARRAADFLAQAIVDGTDAHTDAEAAAGQLFRPAPVGFDVRVRLCPELHTGKRKRSAVNARAWGVMPKQALGAGTLHARSQLLIGIDPPATLSRTLEATLGDTALVFHDALGEQQHGERAHGSPCRTLGLVLRPAAFVPRARVQLATAHLAMPLAARLGTHHDAPLLVSAVEVVRQLATHGDGLLLELHMVADGNQALAALA